MIYSFDTNAFIDAWGKLYPIANFPTFWDHLDERMRDGRVLVVDEVFVELEQKDDQVLAWVKQRSEARCELDEEIQVATRAVLDKHPLMAKERKQHTVADPFVVGLAKAKNAVVVTAEQPTGSRTKPKIPDVCDDLGIEWTTLLGFIQRENFVYR